MNVPNHERKAFKDMTPEERSAIVEAHVAERAEILISGSWVEADNEVILPAYAYRTRPRQLVIPWDVIKPEYKWAAMEESGIVFLYEEKPSVVPYKNKCLDRTSYGWTGGGGFLPCCLNINTTGIAWRESLVQRPE